MPDRPEVVSWSGLEVAIIGMSGRFPGAKNLAAFWHNLCHGVESIAFFTDQELASAGLDPVLLWDPNYVKARGVLEDIEWFDAAFFGFTPREAEIMDPQHRLFLECAWEAMEQAGYHAESSAGTIGVYAGTNMSHYALQLVTNRELIQSIGPMPIILGNDKDYLCTRVSYKLNLEGPSVAVQTSCSTSLVAVHLACQGLLSGACDMALAGGVSISVPHKAGYMYQPGGIYSPDGHCRAFDAAAQGTVSGSGVGIVVLKRLADAVTDGDNILAVIKGSAINNDGAAKVGYTAPRVDGQARAIRAAHSMAEIAAETITYIETHGTGTVLGDPIEVAALTQAFRSSPAARGFCALGSVKTNIGHLDTAAGVAGLIKTVLALQHKLLPPSLHFQQANPQIDFAHSPFYVNTRLSEWPAGQTPRRAGVSSFGIGGTNAHVVLEEAPPTAPSGPSRTWQLLVLSAQSASALETATAHLVEHCERHADLNLADVAFTLQRGRRAFRHRRTLVCQELGEAMRALARRDPARVFTSTVETQEQPVVFMFPGQGTQYVHMGAELYHAEAQFRESVDHCAALLMPHLGLDLRDIMYPGPEQTTAAAQHLAQTSMTQPALFVMEYALAQLWMAWGVHPQAMIGHSIGEYVAACLAGVFSLEDAVALVALRGRLMQQLPTGTMLAVALSEQEVQALLGTTLSLAAHNGPSSCVVAGPESDITLLEQQLRQRDVPCRRLQTSHAFHSAMMEPIIEPFRVQIDNMDLHHPTLRYVSNVTGTWVTAAEATAAGYWTRHLRHTVRFAEGLHTVLQEPGCLLLEVGPGQTLSTLVRQQPDQAVGHKVLASLPGRQDRVTEMACVLQTLGHLWGAGVEVDWAGFAARERRHRLPLPSYPFERQRYWIASSPQALHVEPQPLACAKQPDMTDWFYVPSWRRSMLPSSQAVAGPGEHQSSWVVFADACGLGAQVVGRLQHQGHEVTTVVMGEHFARLGEGVYSVQPRRRADYEALMQALHSLHNVPTRIVHCWSVTPDDQGSAGDERFAQAQATGFYSVLLLAQALGEQPGTAPRHLVVVSNNLHDVTGAEMLCPEKATLLGCCKVLPQEYPALTCRSLDVVLAPAGTLQAEKLADQITAEISTDVDEPVVAYRGTHRWVQTFEPIRLDSPPVRPTLLRDRGVYLITGGLGGIGLLLAEYLARIVQAKLVLTGREGLPPREEWEHLVTSYERRDHTARQAVRTESRVQLALEEVVETITLSEERISRELNIRGIQHYNGLEESLNTLCSSYIYNYFKENNIDMRVGNIYDKDKLKHMLKVTSKFEKFYEYMINELEKDNVIDITNNKIQILQDKIQSPSILKRNLDKTYPDFKGLTRLLEHCVNHYSRALRGEIEAISVLYPGGSADLLRDTARNTIEHDNRRVYLLLVQEILSTIASNTSGKKLRILEVGGGGGTLTRAIVPGLEHAPVEYYFTDIGKSFVIHAEQEAAKHGIDFMQFGLLDISRNPEMQRYTPHSFDIILGLDVVHATSNIEETLENLKTLLAPNGLLCLIETVKKQRWIEMIWGLAEGWWSFTDEHLRRDSPLLSLDTWETVLQQHGFQSVKAFPQRAEQRLETDFGLIVAQQHAEVMRPDDRDWVTVTRRESRSLIPEKIRKVRELEQLGAEVLVLSADVAQPQQMQSVVQQAQERFGDIHGVIHTAAIAGGGLMHLQTPEMVESEFAPKVQGARVLDRLFAPGQLDFLVLCSSLSSLTGGIGQVAYCAANAFLDALAQARAARHGSYTVSINWDRWRDVGLAVAVEARQKALQGDDVDPGGMTPSEGVAAFHRILSQPAWPQVIVSQQDFPAILEQSRAVRAAHSLETLAQIRLAPSVHPRPPLGQAYVAPRNEVERSLAAIWQEVFGVEPVGIHDDFFELGGESLIALQLLNRLRTAFQADLSLRRFFEAPTIAGLSAALSQTRGHGATAPALVPLSREAHRRQRPV